MNLKLKLNKAIGMLAVVVTLATFTACQPDEVSEGNGISQSNMDASFTATKTDVAGNNYRFSASPNGSIRHTWDIGDGGGPSKGNATQDIFFPDAGTYDVMHTTYGIGGASFSATQRVVVPTSDPVAGNLVQGGKFADPTDHAKWTILNISGTATHWTMNQGSATITGGSGSQQGIYQAIQVEGGKQYKVDMVVSGSGATNTWFEVYVSKTAPTQNSDYSADGTRIGLNTWGGCGNSPFSGKLSVIGCSGSGNTITFPTSGTAYLVIKSGGDNLGTTGITIKDVSFRGSAN